MSRLGALTHTPPSADQHKQSQVKSAARVLDLIEGLAAAPDGLGFSDLARQQALPKSSLHGLLAVLTDRGYVTFDPERRTYSLGIRVWEAGQAYLRHRDLVTEALPVMKQVVARINETVQLATLDGIENVYLAKVDCSHPIRLQSEVGKRLYAHATGLGKALLAFLPEGELRARLDGVTLPAFTDSTIRDLDHLLTVLAVVRERGFAIDNQEYTPGLICVAVPVFDVNDRVIAAVSASIPLLRASEEQVEAALRAIAMASSDLSHRLGRAQPEPRLAALADNRGVGHILDRTTVDAIAARR
ncbi:MAG TPA: IclR family transcriptional regulator [Thermomicrobiales bacterium]|nr:IclR family transcriptional regulator [Thermomicrobiales bacterium]